MSTRFLSGFSISVPIVLVVAACGPADTQPKMPSQGYVTAVFQECREQEALGDASACWKLFLQRYEKAAAPAELEYAKMKSEKPAVVEPTCSPGTAWTGTQCASLCREDSLESWDNGEGACMRQMELECTAYYHQEDGHCVADPTCPAGMRKRAGGGCEMVPAEAPFKAGERVLSLVDQAGAAGKVVVKRGAKGTYWYQRDDLGFVIWDDKVGADPVYPGPETGVPQGKSAYGFWVGNDELAKDSASAEDTTLIPEWCGQRAGKLSFGRVKVGTYVKLGKHRPVGGDTNWAPDMDQYVGKVTRVTELKQLTDSAGCPVVTVDADKGVYRWRIRDLTLAPVVRAQTGQKGGTEAPK